MVLDLTLDTTYKGDIQITMNAYSQMIIRKSSTKMESDWYIALKYPIEVYELNKK